MNQSSLINEHPELENEKMQIEQLIKKLWTPEITPDKDFSKQLKKELQSRIREKKAENPRYLAFYLRNFRFYFSGFSVALGAFCILFVLGFFSFNKSPELLSNPKTLNYRNELAFGNKGFKTPSANNLMATAQYTSVITEKKTKEKKTEYSFWPSIISQLPNRYHIGEKQFPKLTTKYPIFKKIRWEAPEIALLAKGLRFPDFKSSKLKNVSIQNLEFKASKGDENFFLDINEALLRMSKFPKIYENELSNFPTPSDANIKRAVKQQLSQRGISLSNYGEPNITKIPYSSDIELFYPRILDGKEVWNANNRSQEGFELIFSPQTKNIESFYNLNLQSYEVSQYPLSKSLDELLLALEQHGNIDTTKKGEKNSLPMRKGKVILRDQGEYLVPALLFQANNPENKKIIILPLF